MADKEEQTMKRVIMHILLLALGMLMVAAVMILEIDGTLGFLLVTLGVFLIFIGVTWRGLINLLLP